MNSLHIDAHMSNFGAVHVGVRLSWKMHVYMLYWSQGCKQASEVVWCRIWTAMCRPHWERHLLLLQVLLGCQHSRVWLDTIHWQG